MSLESDNLLAMTGLFPREITPHHVAAAESVPGTFERRIRHFLGAEQQPFEYKPGPEKIERLLDKLVAPLKAGEVDAWFAAIGTDNPELLADFTKSLTRARAYLAAVWPRVNVDLGPGPELLPLAADDAAEVASLYHVLDEPTFLLDQMDSWTLTPTQALAFRTVYPDLYDSAAKALETALRDRTARHKAWRPTWQQLAVIRTLKGMPPEDLPVPPPPPAEAKPKDAIDAEGAKTSGQIVDEPRPAETK